MADAIREALEAAVSASLAHDGDDVPPPLHVRNQRRWCVAHEIAAFLRALPGWMTTTPSAGNTCGTMGGLAAAVERAAQRGGEG